MFLTKKGLIRHNQKRVKNHLDRAIKKELFDEVERIINKEELPLECQESENHEIFRMAMVKILKKRVEFYESFTDKKTENEQI